MNAHKQIGNCVYIELSQEKKAVIDVKDWEKLKKYTWYVTRSGKKGNYRWYASAWIKGKTIRLHRLLFNIIGNKEVDHKNGDTLDNRRENVRVCTRQENCQNRKKLNKLCSSVYKGVTWNKRLKKWYAQIRAPDKDRQHSLGYFNSEVDAAKAYNKEAMCLFGNYARLNKVI